MNVLTGGTDVHLVLVDLRGVEPELSGKQAEDRLHEIGVTVNRNAVPFDPRPPMEASGLRIGTPALVTRGLAVRGLRRDRADHRGRRSAPDFDARREELAERVQAIVERYPLYECSACRAGLTRLAQAGALAHARPPRACDAFSASDGAPDRARRALRAAAAAAVTTLLTPLTMLFARRVGAIDEPRERGLSTRPTPLLGGLAIFGGALVAALDLAAGRLRARPPTLWHGVLLGAAVITLVGALDDRFDLHPLRSSPARSLAAVIAVHFGIGVRAITLPFVGALHFPNAGPTNAGPILTVLGARGDDERRQLLRRRRRARGRRLRDHRRDVRGDRLRPRPPRSPACSPRSPPARRSAS